MDVFLIESADFALLRQQSFYEGQVSSLPNDDSDRAWHARQWLKEQATFLQAAGTRVQDARLLQERCGVARSVHRLADVANEAANGPLAQSVEAVAAVDRTLAVLARLARAASRSVPKSVDWEGWHDAVVSANRLLEHPDNARLPGVDLNDVARQFRSIDNIRVMKHIESALDAVGVPWHHHQADLEDAKIAVERALRATRGRARLSDLIAEARECAVRAGVTLDEPWASQGAHPTVPLDLSDQCLAWTITYAIECQWEHAGVAGTAESARLDLVTHTVTVVWEWDSATPDSKPVGGTVLEQRQFGCTVQYDLRWPDLEAEATARDIFAPKKEAE